MYLLRILGSVTQCNFGLSSPKDLFYLNYGFLHLMKDSFVLWQESFDLFDPVLQ